MIYVISKEGKPLMPTKRGGKVRHLLKDGKAAIVRYEPFTIQLLYETPEYTQKIILGVDPGTKNLAFTAITENGKILYQGEVTLRTDIKENITKKKNFKKSKKTEENTIQKSKVSQPQKACRLASSFNKSKTSFSLSDGKKHSFYFTSHYDNT